MTRTPGLVLAVLFIDTYNRNLSSTPFLTSLPVLLSLTPRRRRQSWPSSITVCFILQFGIMQWGLNATSNNGFFINKLIQDNAADRATGFQITGASDGSVGGDLKGTRLNRPSMPA